VTKIESVRTGSLVGKRGKGNSRPWPWYRGEGGLVGSVETKCGKDLDPGKKTSVAGKALFRGECSQKVPLKQWAANRLPIAKSQPE